MPVEHPVLAGVRDENVEAGATEREFAFAEAQVRLGQVVQAAVRVEVVVQLEDVVAHAAEQPVAHRAADQPVVPVVAEDPVAPVVRLDRYAVDHERAAGRLVQQVRIEVQEEARGLGLRVVRVVGRERPVGRVVAERVRVGVRVVPEERPLRLGAGDPVVAGATVQEVVAQAAVDDVGGALRVVDEHG